MKNKFYSILLIAIAFMAIFSAKCFATIDVQFDGEEFSFREPSQTTPYYYRYNNSSSNFELAVFTPPVEIQDHTFDNFKLYTDSDNKLYCKGYDTSSSSWVEFDQLYIWPYYPDTSSFGNRTFDQSFSSTQFILLYSSLDVYEYFESNNVVFPIASQPTVETQGTLAKIVEEQETEKVMEEIVGILPIVIVVLVSLIAIRKAIQWIRQTLKQQ